MDFFVIKKLLFFVNLTSLLLDFHSLKFLTCQPTDPIKKIALKGVFFVLLFT